MGSVSLPSYLLSSNGPMRNTGLSFTGYSSTFTFVSTAKLHHLLQTSLAELVWLESIPGLPSPTLQIYRLHHEGGVLLKEIRSVTPVYVEVISGVPESVSRIVHRSQSYPLTCSTLFHCERGIFSVEIRAALGIHPRLVVPVSDVPSSDRLQTETCSSQTTSYNPLVSRPGVGDCNSTIGQPTYKVVGVVH